MGKPMLLIEFDANKPFALQGKYYLSRDVASSDLTARLQLLTMHFPKLRILWSPSPHATAELFEELKKGRPEPDASKASSVTMDVIDEYNKDRFNPIIHDFIKKLPGVTSRNVYAILNRVESMTQLLAMSVDDLSEMWAKTVLLLSTPAYTALFSLGRQQVQPLEVTAMWPLQQPLRQLLPRARGGVSNPTLQVGVEEGVPTTGEE